MKLRTKLNRNGMWTGIVTEFDERSCFSVFGEAVLGYRVSDQTPRCVASTRKDPQERGICIYFDTEEQVVAKFREYVSYLAEEMHRIEMRMSLGHTYQVVDGTVCILDRA